MVEPNQGRDDNNDDVVVTCNVGCQPKTQEEEESEGQLPITVCDLEGQQQISPSDDGVSPQIGRRSCGITDPDHVDKATPAKERAHPIKDEESQATQEVGTSTTIESTLTSDDAGHDDDDGATSSQETTATPSSSTIELPLSSPTSSSPQRHNSKKEDVTEHDSGSLYLNALDYFHEKNGEIGGFMDADDEELKKTKRTVRMRMVAISVAIILIVLALLFFTRPVRSLVLQ